MSPVISYLVPSYNHENYLPFLLESLCVDIKQLKVSAEVVIVDDGSADQSFSIIQAWAEANRNSFPITYIAQKNKGIAAVLNRMIDLARGQYLRVCASDDVVIGGSTQRLYEQFIQRPNLVCVLADAKVIDAQGALIHPSSIVYHGGRIKRLVKPLSLPKEIIQHWCVAGPTHLLKKDHHQRMRYDESCRIEDYDLFLSLLEIPESVIFINETVSLYRIHTTNVSKTNDIKRRIDNIKTFLSIIERYMDRPILAGYLISVKYKTVAKINYLQKKYLSCLFNLCLSTFFKMRSELIN
ncbi:MULTISPECIES: glycosyltransferase family 2 protein [Legionella]|uniref:Glycosyl transferase, family 2 n=1 Tax=Legionella maceachernii TaxID=466 RepID=A0A0W0WCX1_9GAMM|nr:glycosyltransferase family A protein [Legionella maceachernii]KTD30175.1 glycosyl transferase, family 2 [Legionella maceachernii]SJZ92932.1 Glycosyltransferase involved in cell wall bisynthesis [Legionella maceachernii]SUP03484.1 Chondroitin polymerase [Legionella maceachernii]